MSGNQGINFSNGTATISGGLVTGASLGPGCTVNVTGGSVTSGVTIGTDSTLNVTAGSLTAGVRLSATTSWLNISGGSLAGGLDNRTIFGGTVTVSGCSLAVADGVLAGILLDGTPINTPVSGPITLVGDTTPPAINNCPASISRSSDPGKCTTLVNPGTVTASDTCDGTVASIGTRSDGKPLTDPYPAGATTITWTATDVAGNTATCTQTVTVLEKQTPRIKCPADQRVKAGPGNIASVNPGTPTAIDNCSEVTVTGTRSDGKGLQEPYPLGITTITWIAVDAVGNSAACTQKITVR